MMKKKHYRISVPTRNAAVITAVNNGATSAELAAEYEVQWDTIRDSIRNDHYRVKSTPANKGRYEEFLAKVKANDAAAAAKATHTATHSKPQATNSNATTPVKTNRPTNATSPVTQVSQPKNTVLMPTVTTNASNKPSITLVETGVLLHLGVDQLLALNNGNNVYMIPRFCIKELQRMSESTRLANDPVKDKAKTVLLKMYAENIWNLRFIPFEPVEQGMIPKTPDVKGYKTRSFGIAEAALELYIDSSLQVNVLTTSMEIQHLIHRAISDEGLSNEITVTRVYTK